MGARSSIPNQHRNQLTLNPGLHQFDWYGRRREVNITKHKKRRAQTQARAEVYGKEMNRIDSSLPIRLPSSHAPLTLQNRDDIYYAIMKEFESPTSTTSGLLQGLQVNWNVDLWLAEVPALPNEQIRSFAEKILKKIDEMPEGSKSGMADIRLKLAEVEKKTQAPLDPQSPTEVNNVIQMTIKRHNPDFLAIRKCFGDEDQQNADANENVHQKIEWVATKPAQKSESPLVLVPLKKNSYPRSLSSKTEELLKLWPRKIKNLQELADSLKPIATDIKWLLQNNHFSELDTFIEKMVKFSEKNPIQYNKLLSEISEEIGLQEFLRWLSDPSERKRKIATSIFMPCPNMSTAFFKHCIGLAKDRNKLQELRELFSSFKGLFLYDRFEDQDLKFSHRLIQELKDSGCFSEGETANILNALRAFVVTMDLYNCAAKASESTKSEFLESFPLLKEISEIPEHYSKTDIFGWLHLSVLSVKDEDEETDKGIEVLLEIMRSRGPIQTGILLGAMQKPSIELFFGKEAPSERTIVALRAIIHSKNSNDVFKALKNKLNRFPKVKDAVLDDRGGLYTIARLALEVWIQHEPIKSKAKPGKLYVHGALIDA
jgi:hypothetical protein